MFYEIGLRARRKIRSCKTLDHFHNDQLLLLETKYVNLKTDGAGVWLK
jgi:hypothetical protein